MFETTCQRALLKVFNLAKYLSLNSSKEGFSLKYKGIILGRLKNQKDVESIVSFLEKVGGDGNISKKTQKILYLLNSEKLIKENESLKNGLNLLADLLWKKKEEMSDVISFFSCVVITYVKFL